MHRRSVLQSIGALTTHVLFPGILARFALSCQGGPEIRDDYQAQFFSTDNFHALPAIIDLIIPATQSPSASQAGVHYFLDEVFAQCLSEEEQTAMQSGLALLSETLKNSGNESETLRMIDQEAYAGNPGYAFFPRLKQFTLVGFFTSQEGMTQASNYVKIPGEYRGDIEADEQTLNQGKTNMRYYL